MLVGRWRVERDGVTSEGHGAAAEVRYHARSLYSVLSLIGAKEVRVDLFQDGTPMPKEEVTEPRVYYLVRTPNFAAHLISLQPEGPGLTLHSFTYGNNCQLADQP